MPPKSALPDLVAEGVDVCNRAPAADLGESRQLSHVMPHVTNLSTAQSNSNGSARTAGALRQRSKRIAQEMQQYIKLKAAGKPEGIDVWPYMMFDEEPSSKEQEDETKAAKEADADARRSPIDLSGISHLIACIRGEAGTLLEGGLFLLQIDFPDVYPFKPPTVRIHTPMFHPCVAWASSVGYGFMRAPMLTEWTPACTLVKLLEQLKTILHSGMSDQRPADCDYNIQGNGDASGLASRDPVAYTAKVREVVCRDASGWSQLQSCLPERLRVPQTTKLLQQSLGSVPSSDAPQPLGVAYDKSPVQLTEAQTLGGPDEPERPGFGSTGASSQNGVMSVSTAPAGVVAHDHVCGDADNEPQAASTRPPQPEPQDAGIQPPLQEPREQLPRHRSVLAAAEPEPDEENTDVRVLVKTILGEQLECQMPPSMTLWEVKKHICVKSRFEMAEAIRLVAHGKHLSDDDTVGQHAHAANDQGVELVLHTVAGGGFRSHWSAFTQSESRLSVMDTHFHKAATRSILIGALKYDGLPLLRAHQLLSWAKVCNNNNLVLAASQPESQLDGDVVQHVVDILCDRAFEKMFCVESATFANCSQLDDSFWMLLVRAYGQFSDHPYLFVA